MTGIRAATPAELDWLVRADRLADDDPPEPGFDVAAHRAKIAAFVHEPDRGAWLHEERLDGALQPVGALLARFRDPQREPGDAYLEMLLTKVLSHVDARWPAARWPFAEVFQLWVEPPWRRRGIASALKRRFEDEARRRGVPLLYTHTRVTNLHVLELNRRLGYHEVRRGGLWDDEPRVSLVKRLAVD